MEQISRRSGGSSGLKSWVQSDVWNTNLGVSYNFFETLYLAEWKSDYVILEFKCNCICMTFVFIFQTLLAGTCSTAVLSSILWNKAF